MKTLIKFRVVVENKKCPNNLTFAILQFSTLKGKKHSYFPVLSDLDKF